MVVFFVEFEVFGQLGDAFGQDSDLNLGTTGVAFGGREFFNDFGFFVCIQHR